MADFHAADLWVAVVPSTEKVGPAMEEAGREAKSKFGQAVKGIGQTIDDDLHKVGSKAKDTFTSVGQHAKDAFRVAGREAGTILSSELGKAATDAIPGFDKLSGSIQGIGNAVHAAKVGDFTTALDGASQTLKNLEPVAKNFGIDISGWQAPLGDVRDKSKSLTDTYDLLKGNIKDTTDGFRTFTNDAPRFAGAFEMIGKAAGPVAMTLASIAALDKNFAGNMDKLLSGLQSHDPGKILSGGGGMMWDSLKDYSTLFGLAPMPWDRSRESHSSHTFTYWPGFKGAPEGMSRASDGSLIFSGGGIEPYPEHFIGPIPPGAVRAPNGVAPPGTGTSTPPVPTPSAGSSFYRDWYSSGSTTPAPSSGPPSAPSLSSSIGGSSLSTPSVSSRADLHAAGGRVANLFAFAKSLEGTPYSQALRNDCSGMVAKLANVALGLDPVASFSTVNEGQWLFSHGFEPGLGGPNDFNIGWYDHGGGNAGHTAATLPGGIHAESGGSHGSFALGAGAAGAEDPEFTQHAHLSMGNFKASSLAGAQIPTGAEHDPLYVTSTGPGGQTSGSPFESQGQQLGQGLLGGIMQSLGLDGSVFGGKSPLDFGAVKLGTGLLNWGMGTLQSRMQNGPMGAPGLSGGGGGSMLSGLAGLIPHPGPMVSASAGAGGGSFGIKDAVGGPTTIHQDNRIITSGNTIKDAGELVMLQQFERNSRFRGYQGGLPAPS